MVSFSAGITKDNLCDAVAMGVHPATVCSDLLKPGGYGRLAPMLKTLTTELREGGHGDLESYKAARQADAEGAGFTSSVARYVAHLRGEGAADYHLSANEKLPRSVDHELEMFGCVACNFCVTVCPNDAFFSIKSPQEHIEGRQQYLLFTDLCNECGNCMTFCPEDGDPAQIKPRLYADAALFAGRDGQGFLLGADGAIVDHRSDDTSAALVNELLADDAGLPLHAVSPPEGSP